ncbi:MAG: site-specific integrase [Yaniella sp.]|nr:site-specific integrase [Yaniella sp.]
MARKPKKSTDLPRGINLTSNGQTYRARIFHNGKRHTLGTNYETIGSAEAALSIARAEIARDTFVPPAEKKQQVKAEQAEAQQAKTTVAEVAEQFWDFMESSGRTRGTVYTYQSRYRSHIGPVLGDRPIAEVTVEDIDAWYADKKRKHGDGVITSVYLTCSSLFNFAAGKAHGQSRAFKPFITSSPCQVAGGAKHKPKQRESEPVATAEQVAFIADDMPDRYRLAVLFAGWCALRMGEVLGLKRADLTQTDDGRYWVSIRRQVQARGKGLYEESPKSHSGIRDLPVPKALNADVENHLEVFVGRGRDSLVFPRTDGSWCHPNTLRKAFGRGRDKWNTENPDDTLDGFTFHSLRHTALTNLGQAGATLDELMRYAGHASPDVVLKYQHSTRDRLAMLSDSLSALI